MMNFFGGDGNKEKYIAMLNIPTKEEIDKNIKNSKLLSVLELRKSIIEDLFQMEGQMKSFRGKTSAIFQIRT